MVSPKLILAFSVFLCNNFVNGDELYDLLTTKLPKYSDWIIANNFDPSPPYLQPIAHLDTKNKSNVDIVFTLWNHSVQGQSTNITFPDITADLWNRFISIEFGGTGDITYSGDFQAEGTVYYTDGDNNTSFRIMASGSWNISANGYYQLLQLKDFKLSPEGYVDITYSKMSVNGTNNLSSINFEGLIEDCQGDTHCAEILETETSNAYQKLLQRTLIHPNDQLLMKYLTEIFQKSPMPIIETPDTTVPTISSSSSTEKSSAITSHMSVWVLVSAIITGFYIRCSL